MPVTALGDLIRPASSELVAAAHLEGPLRAVGLLPEVTWHMSRVARNIDRYLAEVTRGMWFEQLAQTGDGLDSRAVADAREGLLLAAASLDGSLPRGYGAASAESSPGSGLGARLASAASFLAAGSDLLYSHFAVTGDGPGLAPSDWVSLIRSLPFRTALAVQAADWSRDLSLLAAQLALRVASSPDVPADVPQALGSTASWLLTATTRLAEAVPADAARHPDRALLHAVPPNLAPVRQPPAEAEKGHDLCRGIAVSVLRIGAAARQPRDLREWPLVGTAESWRWKATASAVTCHLVGSLLLPAAGRVADPAGRTPIRAAAQAAGLACDRWRGAAAAWQEFATEATGLDAPGVADCSDLIIRIGRLASGDPQWTPARPAKRSYDARDRVAVRERPSAFVDAAHWAVDALTLMAAEDMAAIAATARADGLYVPIRVAMGGRMRSRGWAATSDVTSLLEAYQAAIAASRQAAVTLGEAAVAVGAPSRALAIVRSIAAPMPPPPHRPARFTGSRHLPGAVFKSGHRLRGPVEKALRSLGTEEGALIARADAIDRASRVLAGSAETLSPQVRLLRLSALERAGRQLIAEAGSGADVPAAEAGGPRAENTAMQVADCSFPVGALDSASRHRPGPADSASTRDGRRPTVPANRGGVIHNGPQP